MIGIFNRYLSHIPNTNILQSLVLILFFFICCLTGFNIFKRPKYYSKYMQCLPLEYEKTNL